MPFGDRLEKLRKAAGLTQVELAEAAGLKQQAVSRLEQGGANPSWDVARRLARALGVTLDALDDPGEAPRPTRKRRKKK